ncbi:PAS domain-containing protein [Pedobacter gandavensis]|uniref:PAS domain-containing protein n=1 Tax=Pedobacter gandavensis TaxID=2679963 RepID=UPI0024787FD8|nr:PAS domain-containing protein [Pedobacter gandavensis]WGQ10663.1 PAS domain-containing protein [Pedobacter gandavensis]
MNKNPNPERCASNSPPAERFENELIKYKQKITNILESFTDAFFEVNLNWEVTFWNKECERLLSKSREEIIGKNLWDQYTKAKSLKFFSEYQRAMQENIAVRFQEYWPGKRIWVEVSAFPSGEGLSVYFKDITEWKRMNRELKKEKKRYYDLFNQSPLPQWVYDFNTLAILQVNDAAIKQYGYSRKEFMKMTLNDNRPQEQISKLADIVSKKIIKGQFNSSIVQHRKKNGEIIFVQVDGNPIMFDHKNARLVIVVDQTEQVNAEIELARSEQRFKSLVQDGSDLIGILDNQGNYKYVSPTTAPILGIEASDFIGKNAFDFIHPEDKSSIQLEFDRLRNDKQVKLPPFRFKNKYGEYRWIETIITNMLDDPSIEGIVSNSRDITERIEHETKTQELLDRFSIVSKATSDAIWDWDITTGKIQWNQAIKSVFGYSDTCYNIEWWEKQIHPDDLVNVQTEFSNLIENTNSKLQLKYRFRCADGSYKCVLDRSFILFGQDHQPIRMIGSLQDITTQNEHLKAIQNQNARLHEISHMQAHDVRAPLARIIGLVNLLDDRVSKETLTAVISHLTSSTYELDEVLRKIINKSS